MSGPVAQDSAWFLVVRTPGRVQGYPTNWKGWLSLAGVILGSTACGLGSGYLWYLTHQWFWFAGYFLTIFPAAFVLLFTLMRIKGRTIDVPSAALSMRANDALALARTQMAAPIGFRNLTLQAIDHVQVAIPPGGEDLARPFYKDLLGLPEQPKPPELAARGGAWFESAAVKVHCGVEDPFTPARKAHIAFRVDDVSGLATRAKAAGFEVVDDDLLPGHERIYIYDPFGNRLEFLRPL